MKRDQTGKFIRNWNSEPKQSVNLSLTQTAWQILKLQASELGISRSELVERYARSLQNGSYCHSGSENNSGEDIIEALVAERTAELLQANTRLQAKIQELQQLIEKTSHLSQETGGTSIPQEEHQILAQASQTFAAARLDLQTLLDTITKLGSEFTGDVCVLSLFFEDGQWLETVSYYHADPQIREFVGEWLKTYPHRVYEGFVNRVIQTGEALLLPITPQQELCAEIKREYKSYLEGFMVSSVLIVPLKLRGKTIGVLNLTRNYPGKPHDRHDQRLFQDLADRAAMAIANAQLYQQAEQARQQAEQIADRTARLQLVTAALSESLTPAQVAEVIVDQSIAALNAAGALVAVVCENGTELEIIHNVGFLSHIVETWRRFPISSSSPLSEAVRTGQPIWEESMEERANRYPHLADIYANCDYAAWISLPLIVEGRAVGGMSFCFHEFSVLSQNDHSFILALSQQAAGAIARAQLYEAEQRARASAEAANRTKDEFLAILSHELRTPLNPIMGWTQLLRKGKLNASKVELALNTIERNTKLQVQLIEDLLDISRILQGKFSLHSTPIDLKLTIEEAIETIRLAAQAKDIQIITSFESDVGHILGDAARLQQVFWNLLSNAVKFTSTGGTIEIRLETIDFQAQIQVKDNGKGINPEFLPYVFDYFRQADSSITRLFGGLGLGLAIVKHIVELHGGTVKAESPGVGQGTTLTVRFPLLSIPTSKMEEEAIMQDRLTLHGVRVLTVDDEVDNLELIAFILEEAGAAVTSLSSAKAVLEVFEQIQPDILVADIGMPEIDGYTLLRQIRNMSPEQGGQVPAIALTAYAGEVNEQQALQAGFQLHISKPVEPDVLIEAIIQIVKQEKS
ncbi:MAG: ATP-binding protein [Scytonema sp. PMC 1069.18]|nr:ATP-binding protein [Scytonema sp. PMC 1069.18]MEC4883311.1 ATP-binding protein [Scytonema sp. PMC 1070.18]